MLDLLIPDDLMTPPTTTPHEVIVEYSHQDQKSFTMQEALDRVEVAQYGTSYTYTTNTFNGTQTFDWNGQPSDSDSDSDCGGDGC